MGKYSRDKGKRGERAWSLFCKAQGYDTHRTAQCCGKSGEAADVVGLPGIHQEVKFVERLNIRDAMAQAVRDADAAGQRALPIVAHKTSRADWLVTMRAVDWFQLFREWEAGGCKLPAS